MSRANSRKRGKQRRSGSVIVWAALSLTVFMGFCALAVDYGGMVTLKNKLQRTCDAAALAGAYNLPANQDMARYNAQNTAYQNQVQVSETAVTFPTTKRCQVKAERRMPFMFARFLGMESGLVNASAVAGRTPLIGVPGNVPLAITIDDYNQYKNGTSFENMLVDNNRQDFRNGTYTALDLHNDDSGKSGTVFQEDLTNGYPGTVFIGENINSALNADLTSQGAKLRRAIDDRIAAAALPPYNDNGTNYNFPDYPVDDPRIVTIIVADPQPANNNNPSITARFFAPVYIQTFRTQSGDTYLRIRILPDRTYNNDDPGIVVGDENGPDTGVSVIRLLG